MEGKAGRSGGLIVLFSTIISTVTALPEMVLFVPGAFNNHLIEALFEHHRHRRHRLRSGEADITGSSYSVS